jgi:hypothetical protein
MIMKKEILIGVVILLAAVSSGYAQEGELHGSIDATFTSKYVWRGIDIFDDHAAIHPSLNLDLFGTGFGFSAVGHRANASGFEAGERWDYTLYYKNALFGDESYATQYMLGWVYYNFPDLSSQAYDLQEIQTVLSWPKILPVEGLVPSYVLVKLWPAEGGSTVGGNASGFAHIFMLDYGLPLEGLLPNVPEQVLNLHSEFVYNDGVDPRGGVVDHDWSNAVFGISTTIDLGNNLYFTPGFYYQSSWDDSINPEDEYWASVGMAYKF